MTAIYTIIHGENTKNSREFLHNLIESSKDHNVLSLDSKQFDVDQINLFLNTSGLINFPKLLILEHFFSSPKATQDKILKILDKSNEKIVIWEEKNLTATQLKTFSQAKIEKFNPDSSVFSCLNQIRPHNLKNFHLSYQKILLNNQFDLFLYLLKGNLRRKINSPTYKKVYLQIIELEYQYKTGQLVISPDIALFRALLPLVS
ncbi:MAG TPA: hypothetical protein PK370_01635 [Candidatus Woesebacteria bacterium]|nr:hypothetical protein [Candidatus Woesebacteria bacterium]HPJ17085.1 hypothetical protein [Candidatus Woesebacteria bacterium]